MKPSESRFHPIRGLRYHVRIWGRAGAPRLILLHGWMDVAASFQFLVDAFAREWQVVAPDWRGFGLTERPPGGYWFPDYFADLEALLDLYEPDAPALIVGHSMGGVVAGLYSGIRARRIARVVVMEGLGLMRHPPSEAPRRYARWLDEEHRPRGFRAYASFAEVAARLRRDNPRLTAARADFLARHWSHETAPGTIELVADPRHKRVNPYLFRIDEALACWRQVTAPVLLINGRQSHIPARMKDTPEQYAERAGAFPDCRTVELEDCGHMMHLDQPERLAVILEAFLTTPLPSS